MQSLVKAKYPTCASTATRQEAARQAHVRRNKNNKGHPMSDEAKKIYIGSDVYECHVDDSLTPSLARALGGITETDAKVEALCVPDSPLWLKWFIQVIRWYRRRISPKLGNRCVFEPSCSHYAELALRDKGIVKGFKLIARRLYWCRPGAGGIDLP